LPAESRESLEERLMTDGELYDELLMAEDDLVDQYLAGSLSVEGLESFERNFLTTDERRRKLSFASAFRRYVAAAEEPTPSAESIARPEPPRRSLFSSLFNFGHPALGRALAAALVLALAVAAFVAVRSWRGAGGAEVAAHVFNVELTPGAVRQAGDEIKRVTPPADATVVRLELESQSEDARGYRATLLSDDGRALLTRESLEARESGGARRVSFDVPAELLTRGDYRVKLSRRTADGSYEDIASYSFRVAR
jgi:hypothetical protein